MRQKSREQKKIYRLVSTTLSSKYFFLIILLIVALQGAWYALSFQPTLFDESKHLARIFIFSEHLSPFFQEQQPAWDHAGAITREGSYLFYYAMGWLLRLINLISTEYIAQVILLRLVSLVFFISGLVVYRKALLKLGGIPSSIINISILFVILTPAFAILPGAVNYDNVGFLLFAVMLWLGVGLVKSKTVKPVSLVLLIITGLITSIVKWTGVALFLPIFLYVIYDLYQKNKSQVFSSFLSAFRKIPRLKKIFLIFFFVVALGLFIERPVQNVLRYGSPDPKCNRVIEGERCMKFHDYAIYAQVGEKKPERFLPLDPAQYFFVFMAPRMINAHVSVLPVVAVRHTSALPLVQTLYFIAIPAGAVLILLYIRSFVRVPPYRFLLFVALFFCAVLFIDLYQAYTKHAIPAALHSRYLLPVYPILLCFAGLSLQRMFHSRKYIALALLLLIFIGLTQGGGVINHSVVAQDRLYWPDERVRRYNEAQRDFLQKFVKESKYTHGVEGY